MDHAAPAVNPIEHVEPVADEAAKTPDDPTPPADATATADPEKGGEKPAEPAAKTAAVPVPSTTELSHDEKDEAGDAGDIVKKEKKPGFFDRFKKAKKDEGKEGGDGEGDATVETKEEEVPPVGFFKLFRWVFFLSSSHDFYECAG